MIIKLAQLAFMKLKVMSSAQELVVREILLAKNFTVQGNILIFNYSGSNPEGINETINNILTASTQLESKISQSQTTTEDIIIKSEETSTTKQQITTILNEVNTIEKKCRNTNPRNKSWRFTNLTY